eukprot:CAMPEP_0203936710 /NCGR_PEP_ID=MMETSP0359-20131031/74156_1 /ASSEMBLY_ACC=CAM_ASM_000338 /TAXON_ID=268821 /ORGANISM="Scrippsiella Hangoei, Strain SHTV-5" /LENGTH=68 /DNA_ID=CAMNT_0050866705 /DNA_START=69 /DNA_END=271 /DNA_ORIENTATION=+
MQEILFALVGHTGGLIAETEDSFVLNGKIDYLSEAEKQIIERIARVGFYCKRLADFSGSVRQRHFKST